MAQAAGADGVLLAGFQMTKFFELIEELLQENELTYRQQHDHQTTEVKEHSTDHESDGKTSGEIK
jgi:hypothetical protein